MTDRDLFIAALEQPDPGAWLTLACPDADTRRRVEILLRAHHQASKFLAVPAGNELAADAPTRTARPGDETTPAAEVDVRAFLTPSDTPGHIGRLDHFEVLEVVGRGGMGVVLKALDPKLHRLVAIKLMSPHLAVSSAARRRFEREAKAVAAVKNEHVVAIHDVHPDAAAPYLVMEFIAGPSLQDRLERTGPLHLNEVLRIGLQAACGLAAAHKQGLVHRDVKPANILLENGVERVKLTDFGLARAADDANLTQSGVIAGTPNYMSPEQANGSAVDARSDLFSLGSVLYALCAGHPPFRADSAMAVLKRVCEEAPRPLTEVNADVPGWLDAIVCKLLAKDPADRFQTAAEVAELLGQHLAHRQNPTAHPMPAGVAPTRPSNAAWTEIFAGSDRPRRVAQLILLVAGVALMIVGAILNASGREMAYLLYIGIGTVFVAGLIQRRWAVPYKGRTIRFEYSMLTGMTLWVDGVRIAKDQVRPRAELFGTIPDGPGAGDEVRVEAEAGFARVWCRISVRESSRPVPAAAPTPAAPAITFRIPERPPVAGCLVVLALLALAVAVLTFRDTIGRFLFLEGYFALGFFALAVGIAGIHGLFARWGKTRGSRVTNALSAAIVLAGTAVGLAVWYEHRGDRTKAFDAVLWSLAGLWASTVVANLYVVFCRQPTTDPAKAGRARLFGALSALAFGTAAAVTVQQLVAVPDATRLSITWNKALVDHVTVERPEGVVDELRADATLVVYPYRPGEHVVRGYWQGELVYTETVRLDPDQERRVSLFEAHSSAGMPIFQVITQGFGASELTFSVTSGDHVLTWHGGDGVTQSLVADVPYLVQATRGKEVIHTETVRMKAGEHRLLQFPRVGPAPRTTDLRPAEGSFPNDVVAMRLSPDRSLVAAARLDGPILVFDTAAGSERYTIRRRKSDCSAFGFTPDGKQLVYVDQPAQKPPEVRFASATDGTSGQRLVAGPGRGIMNSRALAVSADGRRLAVATAINYRGMSGFMSRILRWEADAAGGPFREAAPIEWQSDTISALQFSPDGGRIRAVSGNDNPARYDWKTGQPDQWGAGLAAFDGLAAGPAADVATGWSEWRGSAVASLWNHGQPDSAFNELPPSPIPFGAAAVSADGQRVALGTKGGGDVPWDVRAVVHVHDARTRKEIVLLLGHTDWVMDVAFGPDGKEVMSAGKDGTVRRWTVPE
ncbi:MAG TPA: WD40 repeat domain-containing serine/threonine protein kinase [Gemmataceae bacterium]|nr:WD40 repeat domain-containing serine/threonine protein kinase [Gemmataceae bacterium]